MKKDIIHTIDDIIIDAIEKYKIKILISFIYFDKLNKYNDVVYYITLAYKAIDYNYPYNDIIYKNIQKSIRFINYYLKII